ncbi:ABC transporter permease [Streptomyces sp. NPDC004549]|uniref:ABC transporter permease n=1 Tax=Streptomyces sp. NPDC004549 TaxID=3154283 RepID=UPI0033A4E4F8
MRTDLRLALLLLDGSDRREWWRLGLTALGAALATGFGTAAVAIASVRGMYNVRVGAGLLNDAGTRSGVIVALLLLLVPVLGFLGQCARLGAVHRDRRLAGLRLAGASAAQIRRIAALEAGISCLVGALVATAVSMVVLLRAWQHPPALAWAGWALVLVATPALGMLVSVLALRHVAASPLGLVRRVRPSRGRRPGVALLGAALLLVVAGPLLSSGRTGGFVADITAPLIVLAAVIVVGLGAVWLTGATARFLGARLASRTENPATLIAAERLRDDPWAAARTHAAVLLVTIVGTGFLGVRQALYAALRSSGPQGRPAEDMAYYTTGIGLTGAAVLVALVITLGGLAVGAAESVATRRRGLAAQVAAGVPRPVLERALLLETALPLAPAIALAGVGGTVLGAGYALLVGHSVSLLPLLSVPVLVYAACLLAAATSLPLLRRSAHTAELRAA